MICPNCGIDKESLLASIKEIFDERDRFRIRNEQLEAELADAKDHIDYLILRDDTWRKIVNQRDEQLASIDRAQKETGNDCI